MAALVVRLTGYRVTRLLSYMVIWWGQEGFFVNCGGHSGMTG